MLKKILPIFFILCLVFSLTVLCFAQDIGRPVYYNQILSSNYQTFTSRVTDPSTLQQFSIFASGNFVGSYSVNIGSLSFAKFVPRLDSNYRFFFSGSTRNIDFFYVDLLAGHTYIAVFNFVSYDPSTVGGISYNLCNIVDISLIYDNPSSVTSSQFIIDFPLFGESNVAKTSSTFYNPSITEGFDKMLNFSHVFDRIPYFFDQYTTVTVWIVGSVSLSIVILVIVFMIKRFSGGKS